MAVIFELAPELRGNFPYLKQPKVFDPLEPDMVRPSCTILEKADEVDKALAEATFGDTKCVNGLASVQSFPDSNEPITVTAFSSNPKFSNCGECIVFQRYGCLMGNRMLISVPQQI